MQASACAIIKNVQNSVRETFFTQVVKLFSIFENASLLYHFNSPNHINSLNFLYLCNLLSFLEGVGAVHIVKLLRGRQFSAPFFPIKIIDMNAVIYATNIVYIVENNRFFNGKFYPFSGKYYPFLSRCAISLFFSTICCNIFKEIILHSGTYFYQ